MLSERGLAVVLALALLALGACSSDTGGSDAGTDGRADGWADGGDPTDGGDRTDGGDQADGGDRTDGGDQADGGGDQADGGGDQTDGGDPGGAPECELPFSVPQDHSIPGPSGQVSAREIHLLCAIDFQDIHARVLVKAVPLEMNAIHDTSYEAREAWVCRQGQEQPEALADGMFYYQLFHHNWEEMGVGFDGLRFAFDFAEWCVGGRPCNPVFEIYDVRRLSDDALLADDLPAVCSRVTDTGRPRPLVPQARVPAEGEEIVFERGSNSGQADEQPVHSVTVRALRLDLREASNADFALFLTDHGNDCDGQPCADTGAEGFHIRELDGEWQPEPGFEDLPAVHVTWYGADAYCSWRSYLRLPTEAGWEMAASAAGERIYPWGDGAPGCGQALFDACQAEEPGAACSLDAGRSAEGVCDLAGNAAEWVSDWYQADYYATCTAECRFPRGPTEETGYKVIRGGGFADPAATLRAADRSFAEPTWSSPNVGLRCQGGAGTPWE